MTLPFAAGQDLTAPLLHSATEDTGWTDYTPVWSSSGTLPVLNNGTIKGSWCRVGKLLHCRINQFMGSTTTYGTGDYSWTLPTAAAVVTGFASLPIWTGSAMCLDSTLAYKLGVLSVSSGASVVGVLENTAGNIWGQTHPQTWAVNDYLAFNFIYEPAV